MKKNPLLHNPLWNLTEHPEHKHLERFWARTGIIDTILLKEARGRVLEAGCGDGRFLKKLQQLPRVDSVCGVDIDKKAIECACASGFNAIHANGEILPFKNGAFDSVMSANISVLHMDWEIVLREVNRVLKPRGVFGFDTINTFPLEKVIKSKLLRLLRVTDRVFSGMNGGIKDMKYFRKSTRDAGFRIVSVYTLMPLPFSPYGVLLRGRPFYRAHTHLSGVLKKIS